MQRTKGSLWKGRPQILSENRHRKQSIGFYRPYKEETHGTEQKGSKARGWLSEGDLDSQCSGTAWDASGDGKGCRWEQIVSENHKAHLQIPDQSLGQKCRPNQAGEESILTSVGDDSGNSSRFVTGRVLGQGNFPQAPSPYPIRGGVSSHGKGFCRTTGTGIGFQPSHQQRPSHLLAL